MLFLSGGDRLIITHLKCANILGAIFILRKKGLNRGICLTVIFIHNILNNVLGIFSRIHDLNSYYFHVHL